MTELAPDYFTKPVSEVDPEVADVLVAEARRQETTLEMIASENFVPQAVMDCQGSTLTNKYAEGLPGKRYYGGCEHVDVVETLAIERAKALFGADAVNVQPNSGATANAAAMMAMIKPGDKVLGMRLDHGGHLTHGMQLNFSGKLYEVVAYGVSDEDSRVDMDALARIAEEERPQLIIAGWSAYPRQLDFARFREIADSVGALLMVDMAHFAGLVAAGEHPSPVPHAHVVTTTIHKTLGGARGGMILSTEEWAKKINTAVFPGQQGGPLMHIIAGKAVSLKVAGERAVPRPPAAHARRRGGDRRGAARGRRQRADRRHRRAPRARRPARVRAVGPGRRGSPARDRHHGQPQRGPQRPAARDGHVGPAHRHVGLATRGLGVEDFREIGQVIGSALTGGFGDAEKAELSERTKAIAEAYPLYPHLTPAAV